MTSVLPMLAVSSATLAFAITAAQGATQLTPGGTIDTFFYDDYLATPGDPELFETLLDTVTTSVNEKRDGILDFGDGDFELIEGLYDVTVLLTARVWRGNTGLLTFGYDYAVEDNSEDGDSGSIGFDISGFASYDLSFSYLLNSDFPFGPLIRRSDDGDKISVQYFDEPEGDHTFLSDVSSSIETFLFTTAADDYRLNGTGLIPVYVYSFGTTDRAVAGLPVPSAVPLPAAGLLLMFGLGTLLFARRRSRDA